MTTARSTTRPGGPTLLTFLILCFFTVTGCTAYRAQKSLPPTPDGGELRNLKVHRANITRESLVALMKEYSAALGVSCTHCHLETTSGDEVAFDFASDAKEEKLIARRMILMTRHLNDEWFEPMGFAVSRMSCMTCHRGRAIPIDAPPPLPSN